MIEMALPGLEGSSTEPGSAVRLTPAELIWFAGIFDGEGSCGLRIHQRRPANVIATLHFGPVQRRFVEQARAIMLQIVPGATATLHHQRSKLSKRAFWHFYIARKQEVHALAQALLPYLRVKRLEMLLLLAYLDRALPEKHHRADEVDRALCRLSSRLKKDDFGAKEEAEELLRYVAPSLAALIEVPTFS